MSLALQDQRSYVLFMRPLEILFYVVFSMLLGPAA